MIEFDETAEKAALDQPWYASVYRALQRDRPEEALRQALESLATSRKESKKNDEMVALRAVTKANLKKGDLWNARRFGEEGLQLTKERNDKLQQAAITNVLARLAIKERKQDQAKAQALEAIELYKGSGNKLGVATASNTLALAYLAGKELDQAHEMANQALSEFSDQDNKYGKAEATYTIVQVSLEQERTDEALKMLQDMKTFYEAIPDQVGMGNAELAKAEIYLSLQDLQETIDKATQASELFEGAQETRKRASAVFVIAKAFETANQIQDMCSCAEAAYAFYEEAHDNRGKASCLEMVGYGCASLVSHGQLPKALELFQGAAFAYRQLKDRAKEAEMLNELAKVQLRAFDLTSATPAGGWQPDDIIAPVRNSKRACALYVELGAANSAGHALALQTLAHSLLNTTANEEALGRTIESRRIFKGLGDPSGEATAVVAGATVLQNQGQKDTALQMLQEAKDLAEDGGDPEVIKSVMGQLAELQKKKMPAKTNNSINKVDFAVAFRGDLKMNWTEFESRRIKLPGYAGSSSSSVSKPLVDSEAPSRVPQRRPVLFETKQVPATNLEREQYPIVTK